MSPSRPPARLAAAVSMSLSTSSVVRCSRVRSWALGRRTVRFTVAGEVGGSGDFSIGFAPFDLGLFRLQLFYGRPRGLAFQRSPRQSNAQRSASLRLLARLDERRGTRRL